MKNICIWKLNVLSYLWPVARETKQIKMAGNNSNSMLMVYLIFCFLAKTIKALANRLCLLDVHRVPKKRFALPVCFWPFSQVLLSKIQNVRSVLKSACSEDCKTRSKCPSVCLSICYQNPSASQNHLISLIISAY